MECYHVMICIVFLCNTISVNNTKIKFTKPNYQVSIYQDQGVRKYVTHSEFQMGVYKPPGNETVSFTIREKSEIMNTFTAESFLLGDFYYLRIRTKFFATLNRERVAAYNLSVTAMLGSSDEREVASTQVHVRVLDRNDNCPIFGKEIFDFVVSEDASFTTVVGQVLATDADEGLNSQMFFYTPSVPHDVSRSPFPFSLDPLTGHLHPTERLHRFAAQKLSSRIAAVHRGDPSIINCDIISQALVVVAVVPNNRHSPLITAHKLAVNFDPHLDNYPYAEITVTDKDDTNVPLAPYPIIVKNSSLVAVHFSLEHTATINKYVLRMRLLQLALVPENTVVLVLLEASDLAMSPRVSTLTLTIALSQYRDIFMLTIPPRVLLTIDEDTIVNSSVMLLRPLVHGNRGGENLTGLVFKQVAGIDGSIHEDIVVSSTGVVSVARTLNAEDVYNRERTITVSVSTPSQWYTSASFSPTQLSPPTIQVLLIITDINEYAPVVTNNGSFFTVAENVTVGSTLLQIEAYDPDVSRTTLAYYLFDQDSLPIMLAFHDRHSIVLKSPLDAETMPQFMRVRVLVTDSGLPLPRSTIAHYTIEIGDVNEYSPEFAQNRCNITISRHLPFDSRLGSFLAEDLDRDGRNNIRISLASISLQEPCFSVDAHTGSLVLLCSLRNRIFATVHSFVIRLQTTDGSLVSPKQLVLNVTVVEPGDARLLGMNMVIQACDENNVYWRMLDNLNSLQKHHFKTDTKQDVLRVIGARELPRFVANVASVVHVREEVALGHVIMTIEMKTNDNEGGRDPYESVYVFGLWSASGSSGEQVFVLNRTNLHTATLMVGDRLDRERVQKYSLTLAICDSGKQRYCSTRALTVQVEDINDNKPVFLDSFAGVIEVPENHGPGKKIVQIEASDADQYNVLQYRLVNYRDMFRLHKRTGWLKLRESLDREVRDKYELVLTASDQSRHGPISLTTTQMITIIVTDVNDNKPVFARPSYVLSYPEDLPVGSFLVQVYATDKDLGLNGQVRYALHGLLSDCFKCDKVTGTVHLVCPLSSTASYRLIAVAKDNGRPQSLSSQADFFVRVVRVPRHIYPVQIKDSLKRVMLRENIGHGSLVTTLVMEDTNNTPGRFQFIISGKSTCTACFHINQKGEIITYAEIDRERNTFFWLFVYVEDRTETMIHRSIAEIYIEVIDVNDNWPMPDRAFYKANVQENLQSAQDVLTISGTDADSAVNNSVKFIIISGDPLGHFSISQTGTLKTTERSIDRETSSGGKSTCQFSDSYDIKVSLIDSGIPEKRTAVHVHVDIDDTNDNNPTFLNHNQFVFNLYFSTETIQEYSQDNTKIPIGRVVAVDIDKDLNGTVRYSLVPGYFINQTNDIATLQTFSVDVETGRIYMNSSTNTLSSLRNDTRRDIEYEVKVWAFDLGVPTMWSLTPATVKILLSISNNGSVPILSDGREGLYLAYQLPESIYLLYDECIGYELLSIPIIDSLDPTGSSLQATIEDVNSPFAIFLMKRGGASRYQIDASLVIAQSLIDSKERNFLMISISNGQMTLRQNLTVHIKFYNKESPLFDANTQDPITINITDRTPIPSVIFKTSAKSTSNLDFQISVPNTSNQVPLPADIILYSMTSSNNPDSVQNLFHLHSNNGDLSILLPAYDFIGRTFQLIIEARQKKSTYVKLILHISESNNTTPIFMTSADITRQYIKHLKSLLLSPLGSIDERDKTLMHHHLLKSRIIWFGWIDPSSVVGTLVTTVPAFDKDYGNNSVIIYSIKNDSLWTTYFLMDPDTGDVRVALDLGPLINRIIFLSIVITDKGIPELSNQSVVVIQVRMSTAIERLPQMDKTQMELVIHENVPLNTALYCLKLRSTLFSTMPIQFVLLKTSPQNGNYFGVTRSTGCIMTSSAIDREIILGPITLEIQVQLHTGQISNYNSIASVKIHITDVNDNAPRFLCPLQINGVISESANPGSVIFIKSGVGSESLMRALIIQVEDPDEGDNGTIDYSITSIAASHFQIDSHTGVLSLAAPIDREVFGDYVTLAVHLTDRGKPSLMSHQVLEIIVNILDENDCPAKFEKDFYIQNLLLPTYPNAPLLQFRVTDPDIENKITFSIVDGNKKGFFSVDQHSGWFTISAYKVPRSDELPRVLLMNIRVSDGVHNTQCNITIYCIDDAIRQPLPLEQNSVAWIVPENEVNVPHLVLPRPALSYFTQSYAYIRYVQLSLHPAIVVNELSGSIKLRFSLDREREPHFSLLILARGWDGSHGYINVSVTVTDVNDYTPLFLTDSYSFLVDTNSSGGVQSLKIKAIDLDEGNNGTMSYSMDYLRPYTDEIKLKINSSSGVIIVTRTPAVTMVGKRFTLMVRVIDDGRPRLSATANVVVDIVSNKSPLFSAANYFLTMWEDAAIGSVVTTVYASSSTGHTILYTISSGNEQELFDLDFTAAYLQPGPCVIRLIGSLDYETQIFHTLRISATDPSSSLSHYSTVFITVQDRPDEEPILSNFSYAISISENIPINTIIYSMSVDVNKNNHQEIIFSIEDIENSSPCNSRHFKINKVSGNISINRALDFENCEIHQFWIAATFGGGFSKSTKAIMEVTVIDENDNPPIFLKRNFTAVISSESLPSSLVVIVAATDLDTNSKLHYKIIYSSHDFFRIDQYSGFVRFEPGPTSRSLISQLQSITFKVLVHDTIHSATANVTVKLLSSNYNTPSFKTKIVHMVIPENATIGAEVGRLSATDPDLMDFGTLQYRFIGGFEMDNFNINRNSGKITVKQSLDRENKKVYELRAIVSDGGGKQDFADIFIHVTDINDHKPIFDQSYYEVTVYINQPTLPILQLQARDKDQSSRFRMDYRLIYPPYNLSPVNIDAITGEISLKPNWMSPGILNDTNFNSSSSTTKPHLQVHSLLVQVCEQPIMSYRSAELQVSCGSKVPVTINIFSEPLKYIAVVTCSLKSVSENNLLHQLIAICRVSPANKTTGKWSLIPGESSVGYENNFEIDPTMGYIRSKKVMDYEQQSQYRLTVEYRDTETVTVSTRYMVIDLIDENDCSPIFDNSRYTISVPEDIVVGSRLIQVKAVDLDIDGRDKVMYALDQEALFRIDEFGWIYVIAALDYEKNKVLKLTIFASDIANHVTNTTVTVSLIDINDELPYWTKFTPREEVDILEDCDGCARNFPRLIYRLGARDNDTYSQTEPLRFLISNLNMSPYLSFFTITDDGEILLNQAIDAEKITGPLEIRVLASDGLHWSMEEFVVLVKVQDINDHSPLCPQQSQLITLSEDTKPGTIITTIRAIDRDISAKFNTLTYKLIECTDPYLLLVEPTTGAVIINAPLDREFRAQIKFKIEAADIDLKKCSLSVTVNVTDINDNDPKFTQTKIAPVPENAPYGSVIGKIHAEDADAGLNRRIEYSIIDDSKTSFSIDRHSGIMRVTSLLDRETIPVHKVIVAAADNGKPMARTSSITVTIDLLDINDSPPYFLDIPLQVNVSENARIGARLLTIRAISEDLGQNSVISYSIVMEQNQFKLNSSSGELMLSKNLDYEQNKEFFLSVVASDGGYPSLSTTTVVTIHIIDINDNSPIFPRQPYLFTLMENMPIGRLVGKITALDADSDQNGRLTYSFMDWIHPSIIMYVDQLFRLQRDTGEIFIRFVPDREKQAMYSFNISATDNGVPPLVSTTTVSIEIEDMNDNPPVFDKESYRFLIQVDRSGVIPRGELRADGELFEVGRMLISDKDGPTNSRPFVCSLLNAEITTLFSVKMDVQNDQCVLLVSGLLHLGSRNLIVQVNDNGLTTLYQRTRVVVDVIRLSNIPPEIEPLNVTFVYFHSFTTLKKEATLTRVLVKDRSQAYDMLKFEIILNSSATPQDRYIKDLFRIDSLSGVITTVDQLDSGLYALIVRVINGSLATQRTIFIRIVALTQEMVDSSCVIQMNNMKPNTFFARKFDQKLVEFLTNAMGSKLAYIISAKVSSRVYRRRRRRQLVTDDKIDVLVAVYDENENRFFKSGVLVARINNLIEDLSRILEVSSARAFNNVCNEKNVCVQGHCQTIIKISQQESFNRFQVHGVTFSSPNFVYSSECKCDKYFGGDRCQIPLNKCAHKPCRQNKECRIDPVRPQGYVCECPAFKRGDNCDQVVEIENSSSCLDEQCVLMRESEPIHFNGGGYMRWILGKLGQAHRIDLSFGFRLLQKSATMLEIQWNSLRSLSIDISDRGSLIIRSGYRTIPELDLFESHSEVSNGRWHTLRVSIVGIENMPDWWLHVVLDGLQPRLHSLDAWMEGDSVNQTIMLAARLMLLSDNKWDLLGSSIAGCFKDVIVNGIKVPYQQLPVSVQNPLVQVMSKNINFGCSEKLLSSYCALGVCKNAGLCKQRDDSNVSYTCQCQGPFTGKDCTVFQEPCKFSPCLHNGKCSELVDGYKCSCPKGQSGPQCQWGRACSSILSPCPQFSSCIEHLISDQSSSSVCRCPPSLQGYLCQTDVDECGIRPPLCQPGKGVCHNTYGGYQCNCSLGYSGQHCESDSLVAIHLDTSSLGLSQFHIYMIIGILACLFVLALLTVVILVLRLRPANNMNSRRKKDRNTALSLDPLYQIKAYPGDQCSRYSPSSSMMASSIHHPPGYVGGFMVEPPPGTPGGRSQMSYQPGQGAHYRRLSQDAMDRMSLCSSSHGLKESGTPLQIPAHYQKSSRGQVFLNPGDSRQGLSPHSSTFSLVPCNVGPQQHLHLVPNRNSMLVCHGSGHGRVLYDPMMMAHSNLSLHSSKGVSSHWELNEEVAERSTCDNTPGDGPIVQLGHNLPMRQLSTDTHRTALNGEIEDSIMSWSGQYNDDPVLNKEMISSQEMSFTETTDRSTALLLPRPLNKGMMLHNSLPPVSSHSETVVQPPPAIVNGNNKDSPSTASPSSTSIPSGTNSSDTKGTAPVCEELVLRKKGPKVSPDSNSAEGTECDTDDIEMDQQPIFPLTFLPNRHLQEEDVEDGLAAMPLLDSIV